MLNCLKIKIFNRKFQLLHLNRFCLSKTKAPVAPADESIYEEEILVFSLPDVASEKLKVESEVCVSLYLILYFILYCIILCCCQTFLSVTKSFTYYKPLVYAVR